MSDSPSVSVGENSRALSIAICGAGIGGLALAIKLQQSGFAPILYERRSESQICDEGIFLTLAPNGINALRAIGLADEVLAEGTRTQGLAIFNERGKKLALIDYANHGQRFGAPSVTIGRGKLTRLLLEAARRGGVSLRFSSQITAVDETSDAVIVRTDTGTTPFDVCIGCDGLRSTVRTLIFPELPRPVYSGLIGTGGVAEAEGVPSTDGIMNMTFGTRAFFGYLRAPGEPVFWFNSYPAAESEIAPISEPTVFAKKIADLHREDPLENSRILQAVKAIDRQYPIYDMPKLARWHTDRVVLMGDAAHAVAPHSGQGASMAIEDGLVLAACLSRDAKIADAFSRFVALRRARVETAIQIGRAAGSQKHAQSWLALRVRDLILPLVMPFAAKAQERLFRFRVDLTPLACPHQ